MSPLRRRRLAFLAAGGLGFSFVVAADIHRWLWDELREAAQPSRAREREALAVEHQRRRQQEIERLRGEAP